MIAFIKRLFNRIKPKKVHRCIDCKYRVNIKWNKSWQCNRKWVYGTHIQRGYHRFKSICGNKKPRTSPTWCPLKEIK